MAIKKLIEVEVISQNAEESLKGITRGLNDASKGGENLNNSFSKSDALKGKLTSITDGVAGLNPAFAGAAKGANSLILKMWEVVANPVGLIIAAIVVSLKFLYEAFQSSVAGGKEIKAVFAAISTVGEQIKDAIFGLARSLINLSTAAYKFLTLDFKGAAEDMKKANKESAESFKQLGNAVDGTTAKIAYNLEKQQQANDKARKMSAVAQSETNKLLVQSREILTDETASIKDKKKALEEVTAAETKSSVEKVRIAKVDLDILKAKALALGGEAEKKMKVEIREATIALNESETENAMTGIKLNKQRKMLLRQETADQKEAIDAQTAKLKERQDAEKTIIDEKLKDSLISFQQQRDLVNNDNELSIKDKKAFLKKINEEERKAIAENAKELAAALQKQKDDTDRLKKEVTDAISTAQDKNVEGQISAQEVEIRLVNDKYFRLLELAKQFNQDTQALTDEQANALNDINLKYQKIDYDAKKAADDKKIADDAIVAANKEAMLQGNLSNLELILSLGGKKFAKIQKALAIAEIVRDTIRGINAATSNEIKVPAFIGVIPNPVKAPSLVTTALGIAGAIAKGALSIAAINSDSKSVGGGGGASGGGASGGGGSATPQFNLVGQSSTNQLTSTIAGQQNRPVQTFVVGSQVTSQQALDRNAQQNSVFG